MVYFGQMGCLKKNYEMISVHLVFFNMKQFDFLYFLNLFYFQNLFKLNNFLIQNK